jgi:hypothetical protein
MNIGESGVRLSNEGRSYTSSTLLGVSSGTFDEIDLDKNALTDFHTF